MVYNEKFLILFVKSDRVIDEEIRRMLPPLLIPAKIIYLTEVPVNNNGKTDRDHLLTIINKECNKGFDTIWSCLNKYGIVNPIDTSLSFVDYGVNSLAAAEIAFLLGSASAMADILSAGYSIRNILKKYSNHLESLKYEDNGNENLNVTIFNAILIDESQFDIKWAYNTHRCIDGNPIVFSYENSEYVVVASHSGRVACLDVENGFIEWETRCCEWTSILSNGSPAQPVLCELINIVISTTIAGSVEAFDMVDILTGVRRWRFLSSAPIFSSVTMIRDTIFVSSVSGTILKLQISSGLKTCCINLKEPIFSSISHLDGKLFVASQSGTLFIVSLDLELLYHFKFPNCSFVKPPLLISPNELGLISTDGWLLRIPYPSLDIYVPRFRLANSQVFCGVQVALAGRCLLAGSRDDWLRCFKNSASKDETQTLVSGHEADKPLQDINMVMEGEFRIERPTPKYPDGRRTSAPAVLWSVASFINDQPTTSAIESVSILQRLLEKQRCISSQVNSESSSPDSGIGLDQGIESSELLLGEAVIGLTPSTAVPPQSVCNNVTSTANNLNAIPPLLWPWINEIH
uniref:Carrier domain-containing protein n=1 Tax=Heterorhabditis bacteriophora TaxID=37862 RepID=A0A1I7XKH4_HETBA